jgi:hypothetical protein
VKLILSRKGFDSSAGGCPSPAFPDGSCYALPIPDPRSRIAYGDIHYRGMNVGTLIRNLTGDRRAGQRKAHLDPDLIEGVKPRLEGWTPCLGQSGSAQGHLARQGVTNGDLFLFFGLFRAVEKRRGSWRFLADARPFHALWGWLQIGDIHRIDELAPGELPWAADHPHFHGEPDQRNTLYVAANRLMLDDRDSGYAGAGVFPELTPIHRLTAPDARLVTEWQLPEFFYPSSADEAMTYHQKMHRWSRGTDGCYLKSAARGQEFVYDIREQPAAADWVRELMKGVNP